MLVNCVVAVIAGGRAVVGKIDNTMLVTIEAGHVDLTFHAAANKLEIVLRDIGFSGSIIVRDRRLKIANATALHINLTANSKPAIYSSVTIGMKVAAKVYVKRLGREKISSNPAAKSAVKSRKLTGSPTFDGVLEKSMLTAGPILNVFVVRGEALIEDFRSNIGRRAAGNKVINILFGSGILGVDRVHHVLDAETHLHVDVGKGIEINILNAVNGGGKNSNEKGRADDKLFHNVKRWRK